MSGKTMLLLKDCTEKDMIYGAFVVDKEISDKMQYIINKLSKEFHDEFGEDYYDDLIQYVVSKITELFGMQYHIEYFEYSNRYLTI